MSVDPLTPDFPWYIPYQFTGNMPIAFIDLDGLEEVRPAIHYNPLGQHGNASYPVLGPSEWYFKDRSSASGTFASAAAYNTKNLKVLFINLLIKSIDTMFGLVMKLTKQNQTLNFTMQQEM